MGDPFNSLVSLVVRGVFIVTGPLLGWALDHYGMGNTLLTHMTNKDFAVTQTIVALLAAIFILSNILTDVLYAIVDPRIAYD